MNWKLAIVRTLTDGLAIAITAFVVPGINVVHNRLFSYLILAVVLGLLNAFIKPIIQFFTLPLIFVSYGLVVVVINAVMLFFLAWLMPGRFEIDGLVPLLIGGFVIGILQMVLEGLFGVTPPLVDDTTVKMGEGVHET